MRVLFLALAAWVLALSASLTAPDAAHAADTVLRAPPPGWVRPAPTPPADPAPVGGDAIRAELLDQQVYFDEAGMHTFVRSRTAIYSAQAVVGLGTFAVPWNPASQTVTVHSIEVIRGDQRIDALTGHEFTILRREQNLEGAVVDGLLTATLQLNDLRVGDRIEWSLTIDSRIPLLGDHIEFVAGGAAPMVVDQMFLRASWPAGSAMRLNASPDWSLPPVRREGGRAAVEISESNVQPEAVPEDAPLRFHRRRWIEGSDYGSWADLAAVFHPLFVQASTLAADSPLRAEAERIRAAHPTQEAQVLAALRLVQDQVRYLALAMGEGGLIPASADETWTRRLGDCKAKTALLMALLRELGVEARPVLVSTLIDDLDTRLPMVVLFDHVIVQAEVDGRSVWLDGTRVGDRSLTPPTPIRHGWVLPVRAQGSELTRIDARPPAAPLRQTTIEIDLRQGLYAPAPMTGEILWRGDNAAVTQTQISIANAAQRDAWMRQMWQGLIEGMEVTTVASAYDAETNELRVTVTGKVRLDWSSTGFRQTVIPVSTINWSAGERRPEGPFRDLPITTNYPGYSRFLTTLILPDEGRGFTVQAQEIDQEAAAYRHRRTVAQDGARVTMQRETIVLRPEMTEAERAAAVTPLERLARDYAYVRAPANYDVSADDLDALSADDPTTAEQWVERGLDLNANGQSEAALQAFDRAVALDPASSLAVANRGIVRFWSGQTAEAAADFDKALELNPSERIAFNGRGLIAATEKRYLDAVVEFSLSLRARPDDVWVLTARARTYAMLEQWDRALADLREARRLSSRTDALDMAELDVLVRAGRAAEAVTLADAMAERNPTDADVRQAQSAAREAAGDLAGAEAAITTAMETEADHAPLMIRRAQLRFLQGDLDGGRADLATARPIAQGNVGLLNNLCWTRAVHGVDLTQALADCDAALALRPEVPGVIDSRAFVLLQLGRLEEALAAYDQALALSADRAGSLYGRGLVKKALGRTDEARVDRAAALALDDKAAKDFERYERAAG